jgi:hypothetical protein
MSAIGSVMVMSAEAFPAAVPAAHGCRTCAGLRDVFCVAEVDQRVRDGEDYQLLLVMPGSSPAVRHLAEADAAEPELAVDRVRAAAALAAGVAAHRELRLAVALLTRAFLATVRTP